MKNILRLKLKKQTAAKAAIVMVLCGSLLWADPSGRTNPFARAPFLTNEVLVTYRPYVTRSLALNSASSVGGSFVHLLEHTPPDQGPLARVTLRGKSVEQAISEFQSNSDVAAVQPNFVYHLTATPGDTSYGQLWGLKNSAQTITGPSYGTNNPGTSGKDINAETAWDTITDCTSTVVAVLDSGVNYNHEDLSANMVSGSYSCVGGTGSVGCDFVGTGDNDPMDLNGHGTHVAGTIAARGDNGVGTTGVCWKAKILAVRIADATGSLNSADIVEGVNFAIGTGVGQGNAKVLNMSFGGPASDPAFITALNTAVTNDVVVVVAAGNATQNHNLTASYPCDYTHANIICVAAVDQKYSIATFSDFDTNATAANRKVDIGAPGTNIRSTWAGTETTISDNFGSGWTETHTTGNGWGTFSSGCTNPNDGLSYNLTNPTNLCSGFGYFQSTDDKIQKSFNVTGADRVQLTLYAYIDNWTGDPFSIVYKNVNTDVFSGGTALGFFQNVLASGFVQYELANCVGSTDCGVGFRLQTNSDANIGAVSVRSFSLYTMDKDATNAYKVIDGTSMATPHVAGIATMIRARNPNFTFTDVVNAILTGGDLESSMSAGTKTGRVADAFGALKFIPDTTGPGAGGTLTVSSP